MKICIINVNIYSLFNPKSRASVGGTEVQLFNVANFLSSKELVSVITGNWGQEQDSEIYNGIEVFKSFTLDSGLVNYIKAPFLLWKRMKSVDADVYIASSAGAEIGIIALFCKVYRKKFIYRTAHDIDCNGEFIKNNGVVGRIYKYGLENADIIITQNKDNQEMLKKNHNILAKILRNCYDVPVENIEYNEKKYILWVSRCSEWKRPESFLKIVEEFPEECFVMISPKSDIEKELFGKIKNKALQLANLKFIEKVDFFEIQQYFNKAKLFIGTSDYEGFPNTYLQACMGSTPIISLRVNPDNFISKNSLGYCAKGKFSLMLNNIKDVLKNKDSWQNKSKNALEYAQKNHDIKVIGDKWRKIISNIKK